MSKRGRQHQRRRVAKAVSRTLDAADITAASAAWAALFAAEFPYLGAHKATIHATDFHTFAQMYGLDQTTFETQLTADFRSKSGPDFDVPKLVTKHTKNGSKSVSKTRRTK